MWPYFSVGQQKYLQDRNRIDISATFCCYHDYRLAINIIISPLWVASGGSIVRYIGTATEIL